MAAVAAMNVPDGIRTAIMIGGAAIGLGGIDRNYMLIDMSSFDGVKPHHVPGAPVPSPSSSDLVKHR